MILPIFTFPNPILTTPTKPVSEVTPELSKLIADMFETMHNAQGIGLAAPQIGQGISLCVLEYIDPDDGVIIPRTVLLNPRVTWKSAQTSKEEEACLSIPGILGVVKRPERVRVKAQNEQGKPIEIEADDLFARALQHEIDHLNGVLFTSYVPKKQLRQRVTPEYPRIENHAEF